MQSEISTPSSVIILSTKLQYRYFLLLYSWYKIALQLSRVCWLICSTFLYLNSTNQSGFERKEQWYNWLCKDITNAELYFLNTNCKKKKKEVQNRVKEDQSFDGAAVKSDTNQNHYTAKYFKWFLSLWSQFTSAGCHVTKGFCHIMLPSTHSLSRQPPGPDTEKSITRCSSKYTSNTNRTCGLVSNSRRERLHAMYTVTYT